MFMDFLKNDHEQIHVMYGQYQSNLGQWNVNPRRRPVVWLKHTDSYPSSLE